MPSFHRFGLGLAALGRPGYINLGHGQDFGAGHDMDAMRHNAAAVLNAAYAAGIRYFDAARSYGRAEAFLGDWLRSCGLNREDVFVASKWGYTYTADWRIDADKHEVKDHSVGVLRRQAEESRAILGSYLRLYQIHSTTMESGVLESREVLGELERLRDSGWQIGLSITGTGQAETVRKALTILVDGRHLFSAVQATWNLLERSCGEALAEAKAAGWRVIIKEGLANGRLTSRNDDPGFAQKRRSLERVALEKGCTLDALALAAVLAQPWVDIVLSGATTVTQLASNLIAVDVDWDARTEEALESLGEPSEQYWRTRAGLAWN